MIKNLFLKIGKKFILFKSRLESLSAVSEPCNTIALERIDIFPRKRLYFRISLIATFFIIYIMLFFCFPPNLILSGTTTNGGDMGAHNYIAKFFIEELFPHLRMTGWDMGWFAGMPMLTFYFPLPYFLMALLYKFVGFNISFKLVTILGSLILPVSIYYFGKLFRFKYPFPEFAAIGSMAFLYMKSFTIYGGNFLGTFAGEFSYSISFGLIFIFIAALYRGIERQKFDWLFAVNCLLLACIVLTHLITLIALIIIVPSLFFINRTWRCARYIIAVFAVGFFLSAFWSLPFVLLINWTPEMNWTNLKDIKKLFPLELIPALILAVTGLFFSTLKKDKRMVSVTWTVIIFMSLFFTWDSGRLYNARFLPFIFIFIYLLAAYGLSNLYWVFLTTYPFKKECIQVPVCRDSAARKIIKDSENSGTNINTENADESDKNEGDSDKKMLKNRLKHRIINFASFKNKFYRFAVFAFIPLVAFLGAGAILAGNPLGPAWARHNYTGFENKDDWKLYDSLMKYLDSLPYGRVMFEFDKSIIQKFGTPRSFE
ncbi:MAG: hypothetical protein FJW66_08165, partial [Actinobacteria bacterium]|nr:hypothetical protein [Actinomycetota bacterium]